jgi:hypothetical protein
VHILHIDFINNKSLERLTEKYILSQILLTPINS